MKVKYLYLLLFIFIVCSCNTEIPHDAYFDYLKEDFEDGTPRYRGYWIDKESGKFETVLYSRAQIKDLVCQYYNNNKLSGFCKKFDDDNKLIYYSTMENNMNNGPFFQFYPSGSLKVKGAFSNDKKTGIFQFYNENFELEAIAHYIDDKQYLLKEYYDDSTSFSLKVHVTCPDSLLRSNRFFEVDFYIPYIDSLAEFQDSIFINRDLYTQDEMNNNVLHRPRYKEHLERGWQSIRYDKKSDNPMIKDSAIYIHGFMYKMANENQIDTLDILDPIKIILTDD